MFTHLERRSEDSWMRGREIEEKAIKNTGEDFSCVWDKRIASVGVQSVASVR